MYALTKLMAPRIGKFEISRRLGRGGMGAVYEGYDRSLARRVAVKTLTAELISDHDSRLRFEREAQAAAKLQHPNIITVYELGNFGSKGKPYIVMEYLDGFDLSTLIKATPPIPLLTALTIGAQLCRALDYAHQHDIVHRDIKPGNIRYLADGRIKIMDFGIARMDGVAQITRSGVMVGTPHYMSPEQIRGTKVDGRSDIFSAGCIFYEMLAGIRPFQGDSATAVLYKIVHEPPQPILESCPDIPEQVEHILSQALAKELDNRFRTAREMADELERLEIVYRRTLPRPSARIEQRLTELESLRRNHQWDDAMSLAEAIAAARPDLEVPWQTFQQAALELGKKELQQRMSPDDEARHLSDISKEIRSLSIDVEPEVATVGRAVGDLLADTRESSDEKPTEVEENEIPADVQETEVPVEHHETTSTEPRSRTALWFGSVVAVATMVILAGIAWLQFSPGKDDREVLPPAPELEESSAVADGRVKAIAEEEKDPLAVVEPSERVVLQPEEVRQSPEPIAPEPEGEALAQDDRLVSNREPETEPDPPPAIVESLPAETVPAETTAVTTPVDPPAEAAENVPEVVVPPIVGTVRVRSQYPLSVVSGGVSLAEGVNDVSVELEVGLQEVVLIAPEVFLDRPTTVEIQQGKTSYLYAPELGRASIRAFPENGFLTIDGFEAKGLPLTDMPIVEGSHTFRFQWPSGRSSEQTVVVQKGKRAYVTGQY